MRAVTREIRKQVDIKAPSMLRVINHELSRNFPAGERLVLTEMDRFNKYGGGAFVRGVTWKTKDVCKGKCSLYPGKKSNNKSQYYKQGLKYCRTCEHYIKTDNKFCGCCKKQYRTKARHIRNRNRI